MTLSVRQGLTWESNTLSATYSSGLSIVGVPDGKSFMRQPVGNTNVFATQTTTRAGSAGRHIPFRKKKWVAKNSDWSQIKLSWANHVESFSTDIINSIPDVVIRGSILKGSTYYPATWSGASEKVVPVGTFVQTDNISGLNLTKNTEYEEVGCYTIPLMIKSITTLFTTGQVVTGAGGATGTIFSQKGYASLTNGTGTIAVGDTFTGSPSGKTATVTGIITQSGTAPTKVATVILSSPATFPVADVVTASPSGAVYTVSVSGSLAVLTSETGTFVANEAITDPLGGAGAVDFTNVQNITTSIGTQACFLEGILGTNDSTKMYLTSLPVTRAVYTANVTAGNIVSFNQISTGLNYTSGCSVIAYEYSGGVLYTKTVGNSNRTGTSQTSITLTDGTPPSGLAAWVSPTITLSGGGDFGASTAIKCFDATTGIPSVPTSSLLLVGDSIARGYTSADSVGDLYHNFGFHERALLNKCGVINAAISSATAQTFANTTFFQYTYAFLSAHSTTHLEMAMGINDITNGNSTATNRTNLNSIKTTLTGYYPTLKTRFNTYMPCVTTTDSGATEVNQTTKTGCGAGGVLDTLNADVLANTNLVSTWAICNPYAVVRGDDPNKWNSPASSVPETSAISTDGTHPVLPYGIAKLANNATIQASYNSIA